MMLEYEWGNPAAAAAAMMLFGEDAGQERQVFDSYVQHHHHGGMGGELFYQQQQQQQMTAAGLFAGAMSAPPASCHQRYGLGLPPAPARIGLNLGVRTYFSSGSPDRVCRRRTRTARCQAEGCGADLTHAKHYHRRHKVCEFHSKASIVIAAGLSQRFCQQCSRFHVLAEFDQGKRSCRKRLADHNKRRRKSQDLTTTTTTTSNPSANAITTLAVASESSNTEKVLFTATATSSTEPSSSVTRASSPAPAPAQPPVALALGGANFASSSSGASPPSVCFLSNLGDFRGGQEQRFPSWDEAEDGSSIRGLFQTK